ncbi:MAG: FdhF/YdeP family oxidoreductase [Deltaproteobacteria bacterium]|nr:FdhF/YdeP family oxidoreductase [Deltaproteobacteria bacterium]
MNLPFGLNVPKPRHFRDMARVVWRNRDQLPYAWRILRDGVCDGCALGPRGLRDDVIDGVHLCLTRLELLRLNTMAALDPARLADVDRLRAMSSAELRALGRLPFPMLLARGARAFRRLTWNEAETLAADRLRATTPERMAFFTTSRGLTNEVYYLAQKVARALGTNNVDNDARLCHAASTTAMKRSLGVAAATCSLKDWIGTDLLVVWGSDLANNQPVSTKYLHYAKAAGTRVLVVNPFREPGLERYWVPSIAQSAVLGTRLMDAFFPVTVGGDRAFANGVLKALLGRGAVDHAFVAAHTTGFEALEREVAAQDWAFLERESGLPRAEMERFAALYAGARSAVFVWSMGVTQHRFGVENVTAILNLALARGMLGRPHTGLMPIRGHSGVQGAAECGSAPNLLPGGEPFDDTAAHARIEAVFGFPLPSMPGMMTAEMLDAAHAGRLDVLYLLGGNFLETMPDPAWCSDALARVPLRIHQDIVLNSSTLVEGGDVLVLPAATRYEQRGGGTSTTTERRVRFSPEIPGRRIGEARSEWEILAAIGRRAVTDERRDALAFVDGQAVRHEMERAMPLYLGIAGLRRAGDAVQYGGPLLCRDGVCPGLPGGRARFFPIPLAPTDRAPGEFIVTTRRGKQFNSMTQSATDALTGTRGRDAVFMAPVDAERLGLVEGAPLELVSRLGRFRGRCRIARVAPGTLQVYWPEGNVLIERRLDPASGEPDYNAVVRVERSPTSCPPDDASR